MPTNKTQVAAVQAIAWFVKEGSGFRRMVNVDLETQNAKPLPHQHIPVDEDGLIEISGHLLIPSTQQQLHLN